jgi:hypothetical protein
MLRFLLDEHLAPDIALELRRHQPLIEVVTLPDWRGGTLLGESDDAILEAAVEASFTLVTYDQRTIRPLLIEWAAIGKSHGGVIFIDDKTIPLHSWRRIPAALLAFWERYEDLDWTNRSAYLARPSRP